jgi:hypothetical protein
MMRFCWQNRVILQHASPGGSSAETSAAKRTPHGVAAAKVAQTSKSVYPESIRGWSRVSKPAACAIAARPADWEVGDTAGLETCATRRFLFLFPGLPGRIMAAAMA